MLRKLIKVELKNIIRDPMTTFMLIYPVIFALLGRYLIPYIQEKNPDMNQWLMDMIVMFIAVMTGFVYGAIAGFSILDDRDDLVFLSVKISPLSIKTYVFFKVIFIYIMAFFASLFIFWFADLYNFSFGHMVELSLLASLQAPITAFLINSLASNKVEGFAIMKLTGVLLMFPIAAIFFNDWKEFLFSIAPPFWVAKAIMVQYYESIGIPQTFNLGYYGYLVIGFIYSALLIYVTFKIFSKRNNI